MEEEIKKDKRKNDALWKFLAIFISVVLFTILFICKYYLENFPLALVVVMAITILIFALLMWFGFDIFKRFKLSKKKEIDLDKVPEPISILEARGLALGLVNNPEYAEYFSGIEGEPLHSVGKNKICTIYEFIGIGIFEKEKYHILINLNYPNRHSILIAPKVAELNRTINGLGVEPNEKPDEEVTETNNPMLGTTSKTTKKTYKKKKKEEPKNKEGFR